MKVIKPQKLGLLHRVFENDRRCYFVVTLFMCFDVDEPKKLLGEVGMWKLAADELKSESGVIDEGLSKVSGEVLVTGRCYPSGGKPAQVSFVRVKMANVDKRLAVLGDRRFKLGVPTNPEPFTEMPVDWAHAFGGEGYDKNPLGRGFATISTPEGKVHPMPNVELPDKLIVGPKDKPMPAGFGAYELMWPQRFSKVGTYDQKWMETRFPGIAADLDPRFYNVAPEDQWIEGYFKVDEAYVVENMHPSRSRIEGRLPGFIARAFVEHEKPGGEIVFREIQTRIDTVRLIPHRERVIVVHRGMIEIAEDDAADIKTLLIAIDDAAAPRSTAHFRAVMDKRKDPGKGGVDSLREHELLPPGVATPFSTDEDNDLKGIVPEDSPLQENLTQRRADERVKARKDLEARGLDPKAFGYDDAAVEEDPVPAPNDVEGSLEWVDRQMAKLEGQKKDLEGKQKEMEAKARAVYAERNIDYDAAVAKAKKDSAGPPKFSAQAHLERMRDLCRLARDGGAPMPELEAEIEDPGYRADLVVQEKQILKMYRQGAHRQYPVEPLSVVQSETVRAELTAAKLADIAMPDRDFTGADLSGLDLSGVDLSGVFLESVNLEGTNLSRAKLAGAVFARGNLVGTNFSGADLRGVNLGDATIKNVSFDGADLSGAILSLARVSASTFKDAKLERAQLYEAKIGEGVDFSGAKAKGLMVLRVDMPGARFDGADFSGGAFAELDLTGASFHGAILEKTTFLHCKLDRASFRGGNLFGAQLVHGTTATEADFSDASLKNANLRAAELTSAKFGRAELGSADFSGANASKCNFYRAKAREALFIRTNLSDAGMISIDLMNGILQKATLHGTDLSGANLFRADMSRVRVDGRTKIGDTNMNQARVLPRNK